MNRNERFAEAIGNVDENLIFESQPKSLALNKSKKRIWRMASIAACFCLLLVSVLAIQMMKNKAEAQTLQYNNAIYYICGEEGEAEILHNAGLPDTLSAGLCGKQIAYLKSHKNVYTVSEARTDIVMYEYNQGKSDNVYILKIDGKYYAAILHDDKGYHGLY